MKRILVVLLVVITLAAVTVGVSGSTANYASLGPEVKIRAYPDNPKEPYLTLTESRTRYGWPVWKGTVTNPLEKKIYGVRVGARAFNQNREALKPYVTTYVGPITGDSILRTGESGSFELRWRPVVAEEADGLAFYDLFVEFSYFDGETWHKYEWEYPDGYKRLVVHYQ